MADAIVRILQLWKGGILIMDEVDVLLHPLRSELNFPIGNKQAIDLSGYRWDLPIHMLDCLFYVKRGSVCEPIETWKAAEQLAGYTAQSILQEISKVIAHGYEIHALQKTPHLVLLSPLFYQEQMRNVVAKWVLLWLYTHFVGTVNVSTSILLQYLQGEKIEDIRQAIEDG